MEVFTKDELLKQLDGMKELAKKCKKETMFHASFEFTAIDKDFMELAKQYNIKKALKIKADMEKIKNKKDNI